MNSPNDVLALVTDLLLFLAAVRLFGVVFIREAPVSTSLGWRAMFAGGGILLALAAFLHGAGIEDDLGSGLLVGIRLVATVLLMVGGLTRVSPLARRTTVLAGVALLGSELLFAGGFMNAGAVVQGGAAVLFGVAVMAVVREWLALRGAVVASAVLVAMVVSLAIVLPVALSGSFDSEEIRRAEERAEAEQERLEEAIDRSIAQAQLVARGLEPLPDFSVAAQREDGASMKAILANARSRHLGVDVLAFFTNSGLALAADGVSPEALGAWKASRTVEATLGGDPSGGIEELADGALFAVGGSVTKLNIFPQPPAPGVAPYPSGTYPSVARVEFLQVAGLPGGPAGVVIVGSRLDAGTLGMSLRGDDNMNLILISGTSVVSTFGPPGGSGSNNPKASTEALDEYPGRDLAMQVMASGKPESRSLSIGGETSYASARPVKASDGRTAAVLLAISDGRIGGNFRDSLMPTLFLVLAIPATALLVAGAIAGVRVEAPVRRLTRAAQRMREGDLSVQASITTGSKARGDVGRLGASLASMAGSIGTLTSDLEETAGRLHAVLGGMTEAVLATDAGGKVVLVNPAAQTLLGVDEGAIGRHFTSVVEGHDGSGVPFSELIERAMREGRCFAVGFLHRGDKLLPATLSCAPIHTQISGAVGGPITRVVTGAVCVLRDTRREFEVERMKTEFLAGISHELRTPLAPIKGYAEMLLNKVVTEKQTREFVESILESSDELERVIDILVDFSAIESNSFVLQLGRVDVRDAVKDAIAECSQRDPGHEWRVDVGDSAVHADADRRLIQRSVEELADNAASYSPDGSVITVTVREGDEESALSGASGRYIDIVVEDEGYGLTPQMFEVLDSDDPLGTPSRSRTGGFGLGLPFVARVARAHGGRVIAATRDEGGSAFTIRFPAGEAP